MLNSHLFKVGDVERLFATHPFEHRNVGGLLCTHPFQSAVALLRPLQLRLQHRYVRLQTLVDFALSLNFGFDGAQVLELDEVRLEAFRLVLLGDLPGGATGLLLTWGVHISS